MKITCLLVLDDHLEKNLIDRLTSTNTWHSHTNIVECRMCWLFLGYQKIVELLIQHGATIDIADQRVELEAEQGIVQICYWLYHLMQLGLFILKLGSSTILDLIEGVPRRSQQGIFDLKWSRNCDSYIQRWCLFIYNWKKHVTCTQWLCTIELWVVCRLRSTNSHGW